MKHAIKTFKQWTTLSEAMSFPKRMPRHLEALTFKSPIGSDPWIVMASGGDDFDEAWKLVKKRRKQEKNTTYRDDDDPSEYDYDSFTMYSGGSFHDYWEYIIIYKNNKGDRPWNKREFDKAQKEWGRHMSAAWKAVRDSGDYM